MKIYIYGLHEENKDTIKYVGKTTNLGKRLNQHIKEAFRENKTKKHKWIIFCLRNNINIGIKILEEINNNRWESKEKYWISSISGLTNLAEGGSGGKPKEYTISYNDCKILIKDFDIKSKREWYEFVNSSLYLDIIPKNPREVYNLRGVWISWGDFLGTGRVQDNLLKDVYLSYDEAKEHVKILKYKTVKEWKNNIDKLPKFIPNRPERFYKNRGWKGWGDFLNTGRIANQNKIFVSFEECKEYAAIKKIKNRKEWHSKNRPQNIPSNPDKVYEEWTSWGDFLGTERISDNIVAENYLCYNNAKEWVKSNLSIVSGADWKRSLDKIPDFIPNNPQIYYKNKNRGWEGWNKFLESNHTKKYLSLQDAKIYVRELSISSSRQYLNFVRSNNSNLPKRPDLYYDKWISWKDFLH